MKRFNVAKEQRKLNRKINLSNNIKIRTIILSIFVLVGSIMLFTYSKYSTSVKLDIMHSKVANFLQDDYIINAYVDGDKDDFPGKDDGYYVDQVVCNKGATGTWDDDKWGLLITDADEEETECNVYFKSIQRIYDFEFDSNNDGTGQEFDVPITGIYKIELWGASGGTVNAIGGKGAYVSGNINLTKNEKLYVFIGEGGTTAKKTTFNGGGASGGMYEATNGGGATDVRLVNDEWDSFDSLKTRIIIAGGGGGSVNYGNGKSNGAAAGGLTGYTGTSGNSCSYTVIHPTGGTQTAGGNKGIGYWTNNTTFVSQDGSFGLGGYANQGGGGGGGYYGGGGGSFTGGYVMSGAGGSSFISGYNGCKAVDVSNSTSSSIVHKNNSTFSYNNKDYLFTDMLMIDGKGCNWSTGSASNCGNNQTQPNGTKTAGHDGNGYARISLIEN